MKYYCEVKKTKEVYKGYKKVIIGALQADKRLTYKQAELILEAATIDEPVMLNNQTECFWVETD